jgi:hypothetical protein
MPVTSMVLVGALTMVAIGQGMQPLAGERSGPQRNAGERVSRPYRLIFTAPEPGKAVEVQAAPEIVPTNPQQQPRVVCGMVVVPVTPAVDPKMVAHAPTNDPNLAFKIRVIEPRICNK